MTALFRNRPLWGHEPRSSGPDGPVEAAGPLRRMPPAPLGLRMHQRRRPVRPAAGNALLTAALALLLVTSIGPVELATAGDQPKPRQPAAAPSATQPATTQPSATAPAGGMPKARFDEPVHEFPETWSGDVIENTWVVRNEGGGILEILNVEPGCGCTAAEHDRQIPPGGRGKITARLDTRGLSGEVDKTILVRTNDPQARSITLRFRGRVKPRIRMDPPSGAQFGQVAPAGDLTKTITLTNNTDAPLQIEFPATQPSAFTHTLKEVEPGQVYELTISADRSRLKEGANNTQVKFKTGLPGEAEFSVPVNLYLPPLIQAMPPTIAVVTPVATPLHREILLRHTGRGSMKITGVSATDPAIRVQAREVPPPPQPAGAKPRVPGRSWKLRIDIPKGWNPPQAQPAGEPQPQSAPAPIEIVAKTDVKEKPEVRIRVQPFAMSRTNSQKPAATQPR